mgnify:FL=1
MEKKKINRRNFISRYASAALAFTIIPRHVLGGPGFMPPSDQLTKGIIGVGGMGLSHFDYEGTKLLAVCDVDRNHLKSAIEKAGGEY